MVIISRIIVGAAITSLFLVLRSYTLVLGRDEVRLDL
jgi:hypothetical protein